MKCRVLLFLFAVPVFLPAQAPAFSPTPTPVKEWYAFDAAWGGPGNGAGQLSEPQGLAVAPDGTLYIADTGNHRISVWDEDGNPKTTFGTWGSAAVWKNPPQFNRPTGVRVHPSGRIYVADSLNHRIVVLDQQGLVVRSFGGRGTRPGELDLPRSLCFDAFGNLWVLENGNSRVQIFSALGAYRSTWGSFGEKEGQMKHPLAMDLNHIDQAIVADTDNFRIQVFNDQGEPVTFQGWYGDGPYQFQEPSGVAVTPSGLIAVSDGVSGRVQFFNQRFEYVGEWRAMDRIASKDFHPRFRGLAADAQNRLYIADAGNHRILRLKPLFKETFLPEAKTTPSPQVEDRFYGGQGYPVR